MDKLYQIIEYNMNHDEALAFKIALMWEELSQKYFPRENCGKIKKQGDPRQCNLFFYCHKLVRETRNLIPIDQYRYYIQAQFDILKNLRDSSGQHANIAPWCLTGKKAWIRWKIWLIKFKILEKSSKIEISAPISKIKNKIKKTKEFLFNQYKGPPSHDDICKAIDNKTMIRWVMLGKVCGYYMLLSKHVKKCLDLDTFEEKYYFDLTIYKAHLTEEVESFFIEEFKYECS